MSHDEKQHISMVEYSQDGAFPEKASGSQPIGVHVENLAEVGKPPNPWGKGARKLYMMCALLYLCSTMNGNWSLFHT